MTYPLYLHDAYLKEAQATILEVIKENDLVARDLDFSFRLAEHEELERESIYLQPGLPTNKPLRLLTLSGVGSVADGGTQVNKTSEVGKISILPIEMKDGMTFIHYRLV